MRSLAAFLVLLSGAAALAGSVYSWTDKSGGVHYTNNLASVPRGAHVTKVLEDDEPAPPPAQAAAHQPTATAPAVAPSAVPSAGLSGLEQKILDGIDRRAWRTDFALAYDPEYGPAFLRLAETRTDPVVVTAALKGICNLYTPNPGAGASFNGKPYHRLRSTDAVYRAGLAHLADPDFHVRIQAARVAGLGAWGPSPRDYVLAALAARIPLETDPGVLQQLRAALWSCHRGRPELVEAALSGTSATDVLSQFDGLMAMQLAGRSGRDFDAASLDRMRKAAESHLDSEEPMVRFAALRAWRATTRQSPEVVRAKLLELTQSTDPLTRYGATRLLGEDSSLSVVPTLLAMLADTTSFDVKPRDGLPGMPDCNIAEAALSSLAAVSRRGLSANTFEFRPARKPLKGAALAAEVARARAWAAANARALGLSR